MEENRPRILVKKKKDALTSEERTGFVLVLFTGIGAMIIGSFYMIRSVQAPFDINYEGPLLLSPAEERALEIERQKTRDTDGDGLTDFAELYEHRTSPYLRDTDGDGVTDDVEIAVEGGVDTPIDPAGQPQSNEFLDAFGQVFGDSFYIEGQGVDAINQSLQGGSIEDLENVTPELLREMLKAQGATEDQLKYITDQQLLSQYLDLLRQYQELEAQERAEAAQGESTDSTEGAGATGSTRSTGSSQETTDQSDE